MKSYKNQTTLRIWDCLLFEGDTVLFRVGITLFNLRSSQLARASSIVDVMDGLGNFTIEKQVVNCHHFMNVRTSIYPPKTLANSSFYSKTSSQKSRGKSLKK
jgi:hypothetical protein